MSATRARRSIVVAVAALALLFAGLMAEEAPAAKKITACVTKKGRDKGAVRFARKCHKGEKKVSWNKKGKTGPAGQTGATGPQGPSGVTDELLETIATQQTTIEQLTTQLSTVTSQLDAVKAQLNGLSPQVAALCTQMDAVTDRVNLLGTVISGIGLNGVLTTLGGAVTLATPVPAALSPFTCP